MALPPNVATIHCIKERQNMSNWKINCMEKKYLGLWHTWFTQQVVAVGWRRSTMAFGRQQNGNRGLTLADVSFKSKQVTRLWSSSNIGVWGALVQYSANRSKTHNGSPLYPLRAGTRVRWADACRSDGI